MLFRSLNKLTEIRDSFRQVAAELDLYIRSRPAGIVMAGLIASPNRGLGGSVPSLGLRHGLDGPFLWGPFLWGPTGHSEHDHAQTEPETGRLHPAANQCSTYKPHGIDLLVPGFYQQDTRARAPQATRSTG